MSANIQHAAVPGVGGGEKAVMTCSLLLPIIFPAPTHGVIISCSLPGEILTGTLRFGGVILCT